MTLLELHPLQDLPFPLQLSFDAADIVYVVDSVDNAHASNMSEDVFVADTTNVDVDATNAAYDAANTVDAFASFAGEYCSLSLAYVHAYIVVATYA